MLRIAYRPIFVTVCFKCFLFMSQGFEGFVFKCKGLRSDESDMKGLFEENLFVVR